MPPTLADLVDALSFYLPPDAIGRHELSNDAWRAVRPHLPQATSRRGLPRDRRQLLNGMLWALRTGAPWRDVPERYGPWKTVCGSALRSVRWRPPTTATTSPT